MNDTTEQLITIVADVLELDKAEIHEDISSTTCEQWDSLRHVSIILSVEDQFGILFAEEDIHTLMSLSALKAALNRQLETRG